MPTYNSRLDSATILPPYGACYIGGMAVSGEDIFSSRYHNITSPTAINAPFPLYLGATCLTADNRLYRYVKANAAVGFGEVVKPDSTIIKDYKAETAVAYDATNLKLTFPNVASATAGALIGMVIYRMGNGASGLGANADARIITQNTGKTVYIDRPLSATPAATDDFFVWSPWQVILTAGATAAALPVVGVSSVGAISSGNFGWVQSRGLCEAAEMGAVTVATGDLLKALAAGRLTNAAIVATEIPVGYAIGNSNAVALTAGDLFPVYLTIE